MLRVFLTHLYVIVMAFVVLTASHIVANRYGDDIINSLTGFAGSADNRIDTMQDSVKDWNKKMLD